MEKSEIAVLKAKHAALMGLCAAKLTPEDEETISCERDFCQRCVKKESRVDFLLKLFSLQDGFEALYSETPPEPDENAARNYLDRALTWLRTQTVSVSPEQARALAREAVLNFGAHFSGKLIHSSATDAALLAPVRPTRQPHLFSRRLRQDAIPLPLDQGKLDNRGVYQRVLKVLYDDPVVPASGLDPAVIEAIRQGADEALAGALQAPVLVDHRLRQVLLPDGDDYLAASPLAAGGFSVLLHDAARALEEAAAEAEPDKRGKESKRGRGRPRKAREQDVSLLPSDSGSVIGDERDEGEAPSDVLPKAAKRLFSRVGLPFGGAIPRNASIHPKSAIQESFFFAAPQRNAEMNAAWRFVFRPWRPYVAKTQAEAIAKQVAGIEQSPVLHDSASLTAVKVQASGILATVVRACHAQAVDFAAGLAEALFRETDGEEREIDEALLRQHRSSELSALDLAIVRQSFNAKYRTAMAETLINIVGRLTVDGQTGQDAFGGAIGRQRAYRAIEKVLEDL
ncbi:MAG: hypothetical protein M0Z76_08395 [Gammaproteobacteria bacterium]|nr:hypothetical protein [Gammaproteobacteria bacterium]